MDTRTPGLNLKHIEDLLSAIEVGAWDWDLTTGSVIYSSAWAHILGYTVDELPQVVDTWEQRVLPEDLLYANAQIERHLSGAWPLYEAEFRMVCKDGSVIWTQDKGRVVEFDQDGRPLRFVGVLQNVMRLKTAELSLRENRETLDLAVNVAGLGTWDWDLVHNKLYYNDEYLRMLGYEQNDMDGSIEEWERMNHPEDFILASRLLDAYIAGQSNRYECEIRMHRKDGTYVWTRDVGRIVARDKDGMPTRLIGGHLNIDALKRSEHRLTEAMEALEHNKQGLEAEIESRTSTLIEQDRMLWTVNQISRRLLTFESQEDFGALVQDCLRMLGESIQRNRVYIWRDSTDEHGETCCTQIYEWVEGALPIQGNEAFECIPYRDLPNFSEATDSGRCLNTAIKDLSDSERFVLEPQGIKTILIAPVSINGKRWGFIGVDNCENDELFTTAEENMLFMSGSMLASTIEKMNNAATMREMEERTQIMLDAMPLCCHLWTPDMQNIGCNQEAARLFGLSSQEEYLKRFYEFSPEFQPDGRRSADLVVEYVTTAFRDGYCHFPWMHQKADGTPLPTEVTLVRIKYKDSFIVVGYTRDLRELKTMLAELQAKEDALRVARDEALLNSKAKSNFLANMSHEIRTPMNAISGLAEIILRESISGKTAEYAKGIKSACNNLLNIINDILDISKIESGKLEIIQSQYELASLLNDVITISRMRLESKPLMFITDIDSRLPARLMGDEIRIKQVLLNMLSNAIKFTQKGHITLRVTGCMVGDQAHLSFAVSDSGVGIHAQDIDRLFAEFERVNTTKNRTIEGTGLGLAISKQLCEMMGGAITVESICGKGSTFTANIPQDCPEYEPLCHMPEKKTALLYEPRERYRLSIAETIANLGSTCVSCTNQSELYECLACGSYDFILTASLHLKKVLSLVDKHQLELTVAVFAEYGETIVDDTAYTIYFPVNCLQISDLLSGQKEGKGFLGGETLSASFTAPDAHVLVVDDNPVNLSVARGLMEPYQFSIDTAINGAAAVDMVKSQQYDLVFMDHMMPVMDGIDATAAIRRLPGDYFASLPIVALTANALVGTREMFIREGMNDFLAKPIEISKLGNIIGKWLPKDKIIRRQPGEEVSPAQEHPAWVIPGVDTVRGIQSVGGIHDNYFNILCIYYTDGQKKLPLLSEYVSQKDTHAFRTEIHALKSASAVIGATALSTLAAKLEAAAQTEDMEFIDKTMPIFLSQFQALLDALAPVLSVGAPATLDLPRKPAGDAVHLKRVLLQMQAAANCANIGQVEALLNRLGTFSWPEEISATLTAIHACLAMFDYDGVVECILRASALQS